MLCSRTETGMRLTFSIDEYAKFDENIRLLRIDLNYWQEWYHDRGEYEKNLPLRLKQGRLLGS